MPLQKNENLQIEYLNSPIGLLELTLMGDVLVGLKMAPKGKTSSLKSKWAGALSDYFKGKIQTFHLPFQAVGTPFQERVWQELCRIPYGQVRIYGEIARMIGSPGAARAVGQAVHHNPIMIVIPCHRVVAANSLGGYAYGLEVKKKLLKIEKN